MTQPAQSASAQPPETEQPQHWLEGILDILTEAVEGGTPGQGTAFLDGTAQDGSGNHGLLATLDNLSAAQASTEIHGTSIVGHARHCALHMDVVVRWERDGDRGPFDWKGSFYPAEVDDAAWDDLRVRLRATYDALRAFARTQKEGEATGDATGSMTGAVAHVAYHLGAIRQMVKALA